MVEEANQSVVLRVVKREPEEAPPQAGDPGIAFETLSDTECASCHATVPLTGARPLERVPCPACGAEVFVPGRLGGFLLRGPIGEGAMGAVFRATDESLGRDVAVKFVRGCEADDPESRERLRREARAAGRLNHPRVAQVYALNFSNGHPYLVMELVTGEDFSHRLAREGRIAEGEVLRMALDVAEGLSALAREGLVHGDIKPGNIVLDRDGRAKLVDFGLSGMRRLEENDRLVGTPNYIAPEILRGAEDTHRSDLFSLGATLYHLLSGRLPIDGERTSDVVKARLMRNPVSSGPLVRQNVSEPTRRIVLRLMEIDPWRRPADGEAAAAGIREALDALEARAAPKPRRKRLEWRLRLTRRGLRRLGLAVAVLALVGGVAWFAFGPKERRARLRERLEQTVSSLGLYSRKPKTVEPDNSGPKWAEPSRNPDAAVPAEPLLPAPLTVSSLAPFTVDLRPAWQSLAIGGDRPSGSTLHVGGTLVVQGAGADMWKGGERYRFVWSRVRGDYAFLATAKVIAREQRLAMSGMMVKGEDPESGSALFFGFLGGGELFLQLRRPAAEPEVVKHSVRPVRQPCHLRLVRRGDSFEACFSSDGQTWYPFAVCAFSLPADNVIGFCVSAQHAATLASATFSNIRLLAPGVDSAPDVREQETVQSGLFSTKPQ